MQSERVAIDFYLLAIKPPYEKNFKEVQMFNDQGKSFLYVDNPMKTISWDIEQPNKGYNILVSSKWVNKQLKEYNFSNYNEHEGLYLTKDEEIVLWDLFEKANNEYNKPNFSKDIIMSYISLILSYTQSFYNGQFDSRSTIYNKVIENFIVT